MNFLRRHPLLVLLLVVVVTRLPALIWGVIDIDETDFLVVGERIAHGDLPYVDIAEQKPILAYLFYGLSASLFGFRILPVQLLSIAWLFATCLVIRRAATLYTGSARAGVVAAWLYALICACNKVSVNAEILLGLPTAGALYFFLRAERGGRWRDDLLTGMCIAAASLFKHQGGMTLFALLLAVGWTGVRGGGRRWLARCASIGLGFVLPWAAVAAVWGALGHLADLYHWNVTYNLGLSGAQTGSALLRFGVGVLLFVAAAAPLPWVLAGRESLRARRGAALGLALCLWLTWVPVSLGGRFYSHYFLQFAPMLALLAAGPAEGLLDRWKALGRARRVALLLVTTLPVLGYLSYGLARGALGGYPGQEPRARAVARWIRTHTDPAARIFVWGHYSPIYYLSQRLPGTRYHNTSIHMGDFDPAHLPAGFDVARHRAAPHVQATIRDLAAHRPLLVVDTAPADIHSWSKVPLAKFPALARYVAAHYRRVASPGGAAVYLRR